MKKNILQIIMAALGALLGWLITEPWEENFTLSRDMFIGSVVGLFIVLFIVLFILSFKYLYFKKIDLLKKNLKHPLVYILPILGVFLNEILYTILYGILISRVISWAFWGLFLGLAINIYDKQKDKIIIGLIGGGLGGALGAILFDVIYLIMAIDAGPIARAFGFLVFAIALALSLIITESLYKKLSGTNRNSFDFNDFKINKNK